MLKLLKSLFGAKPVPILTATRQTEIGTLSWSTEAEAWVSDPTYMNTGFVFGIEGRVDPDAALLRHAADVLNSKDEFMSRVKTFLTEELETKTYLTPLREEIESLDIERVCLFWSNMPNDGMIFFKSPQDERLWRCDYILRLPKGLGFDS
jgi:hypothetical protein